MQGDRHTPTGNFKVGSPYKIKGKLYYPRETYAHSETGIASWYGPGFHGKKTANGEIFNRNELTAAHRTLQMPSIVRVTNLENGRSIVVRINDRGPFAHGRIVDLSEKAADLLGMKTKGTAKVRLDVLEEESRTVANAAKRGLSTRGSELALNNAQYRRHKFEKNDRTGSVPWKQGIISFPVPSNKPAANSHINNLYQNNFVAQKPMTVPPKSIFVEIRDFVNEDAAHTLRNALYAIEEPVNVLRSTENSRILYKVQIGPVATVEKADKILNMLVRQGRNAEIVVASR